MSKKSFFERLTGAIHMDDDFIQQNPSQNKIADNQMYASQPTQPLAVKHAGKKQAANTTEEWEEQTDGQLAVDVYQTQDEIIIKTMVAGVKPEHLEVNISRDMVSIKGSREQVTEDGSDFFHQELYWGSFSRTIMLPEEIDIEGAEAVEKYGMLTLHLPKLDKHRQTKLKVKSQI